jgi:charged multivesicular body protein 2A
MGAEQSKIDPKELAKEQKKIIRKSQRQLERESKKLETQEKKTLTEIKKMAMNGHHDAAKILAKDIAKNRQMRK